MPRLETALALIGAVAAAAALTAFVVVIVRTLQEELRS